MQKAGATAPEGKVFDPVHVHILCEEQVSVVRCDVVSAMGRTAAVRFGPECDFVLRLQDYRLVVLYKSVVNLSELSISNKSQVGRLETYVGDAVGHAVMDRF